MGAERDWWRRAGLVLLRPRDVFAAVRDDSAEAASDRQDIVVALAFGGGVAAALATARDALDDLDVVETLVWLFVTGLAYGFLGYWILGWALSFVVPRLGGADMPRRTRHVFAYALAPFAFALPAGLLFEPLLIPLAVWSLVLLVVGLVVAYRWTYARALAGVGLTVVWLAALAACVWGVLALLGGGL